MSGPWQLTSERLVAYVEAQHCARETQRGRRTTIDSFYRWGKRAGHVRRSPARVLEKVKPGDPNPNPVPDDVYLAALARADADEALWIDLAAEHGLRRAEIRPRRRADAPEVARQLGVARATVSMWEAGKSEPSATNFVRWARLTGQLIEWLAEGVVRPEGLEPPTF